MDRTSEFLSSAKSQIPPSSSPPFQCRGPSPLLVKAAEILSQIQDMETFIRGILEDYVGYHHVLGSTSSRRHVKEINQEAKNKIFQEITLFITGTGSDLNELRHSIRSYCINANSTSRQHHTEIIQFLAVGLGTITERTRYMQQESEKMNANPFKLISSGYGGGNKYSLPTSNERSHSVPTSSTSSAPLTSSSSSTATSVQESPAEGSLSTSKKCPIPSNFAERYGDEVAPVTKLKEYERLASKDKAKLFKETKDLRAKFSEDYNDTMKMEETVGLISNLLGDFVRILQSQEVFVEEVGSHGKAATEQVEQAEEELIKTIERSTKSQRNMAIVTVGLALFLLLLDFLTP